MEAKTARLDWRSPLFSNRSGLAVADDLERKKKKVQQRAWKRTERRKRGKVRKREKLRTFCSIVAPLLAIISDENARAEPGHLPLPVREGSTALAGR